MPLANAISRVHVIFKTHLDIGFTDLAGNVVARYFEEFIPAAINIAAELRERGGDERFIWTTGAWLVYEYLERAGKAETSRAEEAIAAGDLAWHALPFTTHTELMNQALFRHGLSLSQRLDQRFGRQTIAGKMTDVPGHTRGMIPILADAGVELLHIGVNPAATPPAVPDLFRWQHPTGPSVIVMYDKADYGQTTSIPHANVAVQFAHTRDNEPPQGVPDVLRVFRQVQSEFPAASVTASTLCELTRSLRPYARELPMVRSEIGDSWIYGAASDPARMTPYRAAARLYADWIVDRQLEPLDPELDRFARHLMLVPEHTWGLLVEALQDDTSLQGQPLQQLRTSEAGKRMEASWHEQRQEVPRAVEALPGNLRAEVERAIARASASRWSTEGWTVTTARSWHAGAFELTLSESGALTQLRCQDTCREWASVHATLGQFWYESFSADDYKRFVDDYVTLDVDWARKAYTKVLPSDVEASEWVPSVLAVYAKEDSIAFELLVEMTLPERAVQDYGAPGRIQSRWSFPRGGRRIDYAIQWFDKHATRLPTAAWASFSPSVLPNGLWHIDKLGDWIAPDDVVNQGGMMFHGFDHGLRYEDDASTLLIKALDATIVAPSRRALLRFDSRGHSPADGMHFCLWNNVWNTNFPLWHDRDERYRFEIEPRSKLNCAT